MFTGWGHFVYRFRWLVLIFSLISLAVAVFLMGYGGRLGTGEAFGLQTEAGRASKLLKEELPENNSFTLVFSSGTLAATDPAFKEQVVRALEPLRGQPQVDDIRTAYDSATPDPRWISRDGKSTFAVVKLRGSDGELREAYPELRKKVHSGSLDVMATGNLPLNHDFTKTAAADLQRAEMVSLPLALLLLLVVFGSVAAAGMPFGVGILAVAGGYSGTVLLARVTDVSTYATNIVTMIGLGVAIDYSLFIVNRFREEINRRPVSEALPRTMATAGRTIMFSGLTVAIGLLGFLFFNLGDLRSLGVAGTIVVALSVFYGLTFLPALLAILGPRVNALRLPFVHPGRAASGWGLWQKLAVVVMSHPLQVLLPMAAILLLLGSPVLHMRLSGGDYTVLPAEAESRKGAELLEKQFPEGDTNRVVVVLNYPDESPLTPEHTGQLYDISRWLAALPNIARVESAVDLGQDITREQYQQLLSGPREQVPPEVRNALEQTTGKHIAVLTAYTPYRASTEEARKLVRTIREAHPAVDGEVLVTGSTAYDLDSIKSLAEDAPLAIAFVVGATYLVLFLLLGSVLLPLKAVFMNFLSLSASYGALVWIFQDGNLSRWLNFTPGPIDTTTPIIIFCILFGLSMDYEVLLLSRIKEEYLRTGDNTRAVAFGLERTGRLITGAAAIMTVVFFSFALTDIVIIKAIGLGMGIAVVIDATVVRALLVPAAMRLMGRWNWWAPKPLAQLYNRVSLAEASDGLDDNP